MKRFIAVFAIVIMCISCVSISVNAQRDVSNEELLAQELKELGLFRGVSDTDFALGRAPSRVEALVMLIRVLGKENDVTAGVWRHPFTDVPKWADKYVGYAYSNGLTNGQSMTEFGTGDASGAMYITFVLRALGYSDVNGEDFVWSDPFTLAREVGILSDSVNIQQFWRADVVLVSHSALSSYLNGTQQTLAQKLIAAEVFTKAQFDRLYNSSKNSATKPTFGNNELSAEEIYEMCSPAVFYIEIYNGLKQTLGNASGFFIDDKGTAVTNYHVIERAYSAKIQMSDTGKVYNVIGIYDFSEEQDWAVIQVDCTGNEYLEIGNPSTVVGGATIYTIGSPLGFQNTISEGLISNPKRVLDGIDHIQISAPISHGNSGGALLNKMGHVIGITTSGRDDAQNLNFVIPVTYFQNYLRKKLTKFSEWFGDYEIDSTAEKHTAYYLLKGFIRNNYNYVTKQQRRGFCKDYSENGVSFSSLILFANNTGISVYVLKTSESGSTFAYFFDITPDSENSAGGYKYFIETENEEAVEISSGKTLVECSKLDGDYVFDFTEYEGDDRLVDSLVAKMMHIDGLNFINMIFDKYLGNTGVYSVADLGYTSYDESEKIVYSRIDYKLSSQEINLSVGETASVILDIECAGFPESFDVEAVSENEDVAFADFADDADSLPWEITVKGISIGTTELKITNSYNDQYITAKITVK